MKEGSRSREDLESLAPGSTRCGRRRWRSSATSTIPAKKRSQTPVLDEFARDLTQLARESKLDPVIAASRRSSESSRSWPAAPRTTRC